MKSEKRPMAITIACLLMAVGLIPALFIVFSEEAANVGRWYPPFMAFTVVGGFVCLVYMWMMKKIGVYLYVGMFAVAQTVILSMGFFNIASMIPSLILIAVGFMNIKKMD